MDEVLAKEKLSGKADEERNKLKQQLVSIKEDFPALKTEDDWAKEDRPLPNIGM